MRVGPRRGLKFREESLTDHNLFELDQRHPGLTVYKFDGREEALNGADFDWWIGSDASGWLGMRFQAKKLDDGSYKELGRWVGSERQYDILLRESRMDGVWPMYCFYNGWDGPWPAAVTNRVCPRNYEPPPLLKSRTGRDCGHTKLEHFGCAVAPAPAVARRHRGQRGGRLELDSYLPASIPWSFLLGIPAPVRDSAVGSTPGPLDATMSALRSLFAAQDLEWEGETHDALPHWIDALGRDERGDSRYVPKPKMVVVQELNGDPMFSSTVG